MGETNSNGNRRQPNFGDLLHAAEIAVLLISIGVSYAKFEAAAVQVEKHGIVLERIEHYLSSKDSNYWRQSKNDQ